jgi:LPS-assembly protein
MKKIYTVCIFTSLFCADVSAAGLDTNAPKTIIAPKIEYDVTAKAIKTSGNTSITNQVGQSVNLTDAYLDEKNTNVSGDEAVLYLSNKTKITAKSIEKNGDITKASHLTYTTCANCGDFIDAWSLSASKLKHENSKMEMTFYNPVLWFYDVPIFWFPRMSYPDPRVKYKTGFLFPYLNSTNNMGMQVNVPFYINFSDNHDVMVTASYLTEEKMLWQVEHRLNMKHSSMKTTGSYTHNNAGIDRWHLFNKDLIELGDNARAYVFFDRTSDKTYLQQYDFYNDQPYLDSGARLELFASRGYTTIDTHFFQELRVLSGNYTNPSGDILPNIHGVYQTEPIFNNSYLSFMGDVLGISNDSSTSQRLIGSAQIISPWILPFGQKLTLSASTRYDAYNFINTPIYGVTDDFSGVKTRFLPSGYVQWSLPFIKNGENWTHIIEPKARLTVQRKLDSPGFVNTDSAGSLLSDVMLFSDNRLSGYDLWTNGNYADYGVDWSAFSINDLRSELFVGQSYDFFSPGKLDPNSGFHDGASDYVARAAFYTGEDFSFLNRFRFANDGMGLRHFESNARLGTDDYVEVGYIRATQFTDALVLDRVISEAVLGAGIKLTDRLSLKTRIIYNISDSRIQRLGTGLYYEHPCYTISFDYSKDGAERIYQDGENYYGGTRFKFQFALKLTEGKE